MSRREKFKDGKYFTIFECDQCGKSVELTFPELPPRGWVVLKNFRNGKAVYGRGIAFWSTAGEHFCSKNCSMIWENAHS